MPSEPPTNGYLKNYRRDFGEFVEWLCGGASSRELGRLIGVNHSTISEMRAGIPPGYRTLERFAEGLATLPDHPAADKRNRYELFKRAGYTMSEGTPQERLLDWLKDYQERHGPLTLHFSGGAASLTHEEVENLIAYYEEKAKKKDDGGKSVR